VKNLNELKEKLRCHCEGQRYNILWQWVKDGTISFRDFPEICRFNTRLSNVEDEMDDLNMLFIS